RASADAGFAGDNTVAPDLHVVGDLNEVVNLGPLADQGGPKRASVHGGVASDFDIILNDDLPELRELVIPALGKNVTEAVGPDHGSGVKDYAIADARLRIHDDPRVENALRAHDCALSQEGSRTEARARPHRHTAFDLDVRADAHARGPPHLRPDHRRGMNSRRRSGSRPKRFRRSDSREARMSQR